MPDWERELLGASQEPAEAVPDAEPAADAAPVPGDEQPGAAAVEAEAEADAKVTEERQWQPDAADQSAPAV